MHQFLNRPQAVRIQRKHPKKNKFLSQMASIKIAFAPYRISRGLKFLLASIRDSDILRYCTPSKRSSDNKKIVNRSIKTFRERDKRTISNLFASEKFSIDISCCLKLDVYLPWVDMEKNVWPPKNQIVLKNLARIVATETQRYRCLMKTFVDTSAKKHILVLVANSKEKIKMKNDLL